MKLNPHADKPCYPSTSGDSSCEPHVTGGRNETASETLTQRLLTEGDPQQKMRTKDPGPEEMQTI